MRTAFNNGGLDRQQIKPLRAARPISFDEYKAVTTSLRSANRSAYDSAARKNDQNRGQTNAPGKTFTPSEETTPTADTPATSQSKDFSGKRTVAGGGRESNQFNLGKLIGGVAIKGIDESVSSLTSTAAWLENATLGKLFPGTMEYSLIQEINESVQQAKEHNRQYTASNVKAGGKVAEIVDKYGTATVAAIPQAVLAIMSGGASTAAQGTTAGLQAASTAAQAGTGFLSTVNSALSSMAKDPQYWLSFAQTAGNSYEQAKADGTSDAKASLYALSNGLMSAAVEAGGGIQKLPGELQKGSAWFKPWLNSMLDEGKEEVVQGALERGLQNLIYQKDNPLFSTTDEDAIINPKTTAQEFAGGTIVGGILGGGQAIINGVNSAKNGVTQATAGTFSQIGENLNTGIPGQNAVSGGVGGFPVVNRTQSVELPPVVNGQNKTAPEIVNDAEAVNKNVRVGQATVLKNPYNGETPSQGKKMGRVTPVVSNELIAAAEKRIAQAESDSRNGLGAFKNLLTKAYQLVFSATKQVPVSGLSFGGEQYFVDINNGVPGKVISDVNHSPEKLALLEMLPDIVQNGEYVGSTDGKKKVIRYDHFETPVLIKGKPYLALFETEVYPNVNNYKTHRLINVELTQLSGEVTGTPPASAESASTLTGTTVPQAEQGVKNEYTPEQSAQTGAAAQPPLAQQIDSMRQQLMDMQHKQKVDALMTAYEKNVGAVTEESPEYFQKAHLETTEELASADPSSEKYLNLDARDDYEKITARGTTKIKQGFTAFSEQDILYERAKLVNPDGNKFDVAMHGASTAVAFGGVNTNMSPRLLASFIKHHEDYHGQEIRLLSCSTGRSVRGEYCFAEELANALGANVYAPNDLLYILKDGNIKIGERGEGMFVLYKPNKRRRMK